MSKEYLFEGYLKERSHGEGDALFIGDNTLLDLFEDNNLIKKQVTVSYFICKKECSLEDAQMDLFKKVSGISEGELVHHYSEITGYLWTDEDLKIGGHDLLMELYGYSDSCWIAGSKRISHYCILKVVKHDQDS